MFGLGIWEVVIILVVALVVLGPRRLPQLARQLGKALREFQRASYELRRSLEEAATESTPASRPETSVQISPPPTPVGPEAKTPQTPSEAVGPTDADAAEGKGMIG